MGTLRIRKIDPASVTVEQWPEGHQWDFPVLILDDERRCLAHADFQAARDSAVGKDVSDAAYSFAEAEAYRRHLIR